MPGPRSVFPSSATHPLWLSILELLEGKLPSGHVDELVHSARVLRVSPSMLRLAVDSEALSAWVCDGRLSLLDSATTTVTDGAYQLAVIPVDTPSPLNLDPSFSLNSFVQSPLNQDVRAVVETLVRNPGKHTSSLLLYGPSGSGKTHLLCAIAQRLAEQQSAHEVLCLSAQEFSLQLVAAIRVSELPGFRQRLRACSSLLLDDVHELAGREASQNELVQTLDELHPASQVIVTTSLLPPRFDNLIEPLRRRFTSAVRLPLSPPEWETRVAIVLERFARWGSRPDPEIASFLVSELGRDLQRLDGVLTRLMAHPVSGPGLLDVEAVRRALRRDSRPQRPISPEAVVSLVAHHFSLRISDLRAASRSPRVTTPRQIAMYLMRRHCGVSFPEIAKRFRRHHTTALHACRQIEARRDQNASLRAAVILLEKELLLLGEEGG